MSRFVSCLWRALACAVAYFVGTTVGASLVPVLGATLPAMPPAVGPGQLAIVSFLASLTLGAGLGPLASGLRARYLARFAALALLAYVCLGVNTALESAIFTTVGGTMGMIVLFLPATAACAAAAAALFPTSGAPETWPSGWRRFASQFSTAAWFGRLAVAVIAFPVIYLAFGSVVGPFVVDAYRAGAFGLKLPGMGEIIPTQFVRSALFLLASVPALVLWRGPRRRLAAALGLAHFVFVGLFGMLQASWLPGSMRLLHGVELLADSMTYAAVLVLLLVAPAEGPAAGSWDAEVF